MVDVHQSRGTECVRAVAEALRRRPADESPWDATRIALESLFDHQPDLIRGKRAMRVLMSTPTLRARNLEKHLVWARLLVPIVEERWPSTASGLRSESIVQAALACFEVALHQWASAEDTDGVQLLRDCFGTFSLSR